MKALLFLPLLLLMTPSVNAEEFPARKPGLWEIEVSSPHGTHKSKQCSDAKTDAEMQDSMGQMGKNCKKKETRREGDTFTSESECDMMNSHIRSKAVFKGDFSSQYEGEVTSSFDPPMPMMGGMRESKTKISARWLGPCLADQKPGDMILPDGKKINMDAMRKMGPK